jgi:hypothetical protein
MATATKILLWTAILASAAAYDKEAAPAATAAAADATSGTTSDAAADSSGDAGANGSADSAAETQAADSTVVDTAMDAQPMDTASSSDTSAQTDAASPADAAVPLDTAADSAGADSSAADTAADTSLCPAPQPPGTVCEGSYWVCAPGYFHNYGKSACLEATCANMKAALDAALAEVEAKTHGCSGGDEGECVVVATTTACQGSCGLAVNGGMANDVALAVGWVDEHICKAFAFADKCGYSTPKCMAPAPACVDGVCVYKP